MGRGTGPSTVKLYYRIGEVAGIVGVEPHVLRYWETEFPSIRPQKSRSGQRVYSRRDVDKLLRVKELLYAQRFTIAGARQRLREGAVEGVGGGVGGGVVATSTESEAPTSMERGIAPTELSSVTGPSFVAETPLVMVEAALPVVEHTPLPDARGQAAQSLRTALFAVRSEVRRMLDALNHRRCGDQVLADGRLSSEDGAYRNVSEDVDADHVGLSRGGQDSVEVTASVETAEVRAVTVADTSQRAERSRLGT